jgi:hypothetical protein
VNKLFTYEFQDELSYSKDGKEAQAETLTVYAPTNKVLNEVTIIEQEYKKAEMKMGQMQIDLMGKDGLENLKKEIAAEKENSAELKESKEILAKPEHIIETLYSGGADVMKCFKCLEHILTLKLSGKPFSILDESEGKGEKMTSPIFEAMTPLDTKSILGQFISTFIIASPKS